MKKAVKTSSSVAGYIPFFRQSLSLARDKGPDLLQAEYIPHSSLVPALFKRKDCPLVLKFHGDDARIYPFKNPFNLMVTRTMLKVAHHVITGSEEMRTILIGLGLPPVKYQPFIPELMSPFLSRNPKKRPGNFSEYYQDLQFFFSLAGYIPGKVSVKSLMLRGDPRSSGFFSLARARSRYTRKIAHFWVSDTRDSENVDECCRLSSPAYLYRSRSNVSYGSICLRNSSHNQQCRRVS